LKVAIDTNVVLDVLLDRDPHVEDSAQILWAAESGAITALLCATTLTTIHYMTVKTLGRTGSIAAIDQLLAIFDVAAVNRQVLQIAATSKIRDYEDAVLAHAAEIAGATAIITRNPKDFAKSGLLVYTPREWLATRV
jgi:predicted nucleic acid-binding protein